MHHYASTNVVWNPPHTSCMQYTQDDIDRFVEPIINYDVPKHEWNRQGLESIKSFGHDINLEMFKQHTEKWNKIRKLNIYDHVPELTKLANG